MQPFKRGFVNRCVEHGMDKEAAKTLYKDLDKSLTKHASAMDPSVPDVASIPPDLTLMQQIKNFLESQQGGLIGAGAGAGLGALGGAAAGGKKRRGTGAALGALGGGAAGYGAGQFGYPALMELIAKMQAGEAEGSKPMEDMATSISRQSHAMNKSSSAMDPSVPDVASIPPDLSVMQQIKNFLAANQAGLIGAGAGAGLGAGAGALAGGKERRGTGAALGALGGGAAGYGAGEFGYPALMDLVAKMKASDVDPGGETEI